jgi:ATP-dependent DNA helicase PIF1
MWIGKLIADCEIPQEISMVENQFLERLNLLFQNATTNNHPFGDKQVIFLGDFHQLPPVKPFEYCLRCGESIPTKQDPICISQKCKNLEDQIAFKRGDKWAFRAPVWRELKLRHVKLEQIHRQKDTRFQDILNKIRNGTDLTADEWSDLERPKELPPGAFSVRLMSRLAQVKRFNELQLAALRSQAKAWKAHDSCEKLVDSKEGYHDPAIPHKIHEYKESLRDHRFIADLTLKVGARVVLLQNLDPERGLVNGSQGVIIGFQPATQELEKIMEMNGDHKDVRQASMQQYHSSNPRWRPLVRFAKGQVELIPAFASASLRGGSQVQDQYVVCRTQIPLTLAWALSIHKSQGMTLEYVEVLSQDIFESGQLYVALSRATHLDGLRLTGFSRKQLPMDRDVLEFYNTTKWEKLQPRAKKKS